MFSGLRYHDADQFAADLAMLNRCARKAADRGVRLLYHNHNWEFAGSPRVMDLLLEKRAPELGFCPDVGWVAKAGEDVLAFLKQVAADTPLVHFKDFATLDPGVDTVCLGDGVVPLAEVGAWIKSGENCVEWVIAEQDRADIPADEATTRNAQYLRQLFG
jgi:sugar phosphate isomerase/epimerase